MFGRTLGAASVVAFAAVVLASCGGAEQSGVSSSTSNAPTPNEAATFGPGDAISVPTDTAFTIVLDANPTTGYQWTLTDAGDPSVVTPEGSEYRQEPDSEDMVGAGGTETWKFRSGQAGSTTLMLTYARPFAPDENPQTETFDITVT